MENEKDKNFISIGKAKQISGLGEATLRKLCDEKAIKCYKTPSGQRRFDKSDLEKMCNSSIVIPEQKIQKLNFIYGRVSSKKQMDDLSRQLEYIKSKNPKYSSYTVISDVASGINFKRKGLSSILESCLQKTINELVIAHKDRLSRFGFDLIKQIVTKSGGFITVLDDQQNKSTEQELAEDLLSIIHIYSCKQMGKRKYKKHIKNVENTDKTNNRTEKNIP